MSKPLRTGLRRIQLRTASRVLYRRLSLWVTSRIVLRSASKLAVLRPPATTTTGKVLAMVAMEALTQQAEAQGTVSVPEQAMAEVAVAPEVEEATLRRVEVVEAVVTARHHAEAVGEVAVAAQEDVATGEGGVGVELLLEGAERLMVERSGEKY